MKALPLTRYCEAWAAKPTKGDEAIHLPVPPSARSRLALPEHLLGRPSCGMDDGLLRWARNDETGLHMSKRTAIGLMR